MTVEHRMIVGINDIKAVTFECLNCKTRITVQADSLRDVPRVCGSCNTVWWASTDTTAYVSTSAPAPLALIQAIVTMNILIREKKETFRVLFEFDEPKAV